jgi:hypothetical protein
MKEVKIEVFNRKENVTTTLYVEQLSENKFRMIDNDLFNKQLTLGVEFETEINSEKKHEVVKVLKETEFITRRFGLTPNYKESDYRMLGEELTKRGGFWQVDFGSIATVNIPKDFEFDINQVIKDLELVEIID